MNTGSEVPVLSMCKSVSPPVLSCKSGLGPNFFPPPPVIFCDPSTVCSAPMCAHSQQSIRWSILQVSESIWYFPLCLCALCRGEATHFSGLHHSLKETKSPVLCLKRKRCLWWMRMPSVVFEKHVSLSTDYKAPFIGNIFHYIKWTGSLSPSFIRYFSLSLPFFLLLPP